MKHEWRKKEKKYYLPKAKPEFVDVPSFNFYTISGKGNPNSDEFPDYIQALYATSYAVRMSYKQRLEPVGYYQYTVYPLEGVWDITDEAKQQNDYKLNKDDLVFKLMIRQPDFVHPEFAKKMLERTIEKKKLELLNQVQFETIEDGPCIQMLHKGSYDNEPDSFHMMEAYAEREGYTRLSKLHREIYLNDARKVPAEKLMTVLRFQVSIN